MTTSQLKELQSRLELTNLAMSQLVGVSLPQYERYRSGHAIPAPVSRLLLIVAESPSAMRKLKTLAVLPIKKERATQTKSVSHTHGCGILAGVFCPHRNFISPKT